MLKKRTNLYSYIGVCICSFLISAALCLLVSTVLESQLNTVQIILQVFISSILLALLFYNRLTSIIGVISIIAGIIYFFSLLSINSKEELVSFFNWCIQQMPDKEPWYSRDNLNLIHIFTNTGICVLVYLVSLNPYRSRLMSLISLSVIFAVYLTKFAQYNRIVILFLFTGIFTLFAIDKFEYRRHLGDRKSFKTFGKSWYVTVFSILLCLLISGSTIIILDDKNYELRNRTCSNIAADVQSFTGIYTEEQKEFTISLKDLGLQNNDGYIGGDLPKAEHFLLAVAQTDKPFYAKVTAFDEFTGKEWETSFQNNYRINGPFKKKQKQYLTNSMLKKSSVLSRLKNSVTKRKIKFILNIDSPFLPTVGQVYKYTENTKDNINPVLFNSNGQLFSYYGVKRGYSYTIDTFQFNTKNLLSKNDDATLRALNMLNDPLYTEQFLDFYTNIPVRFGDSINELVKLMKLNPENHFDTAIKVCNYFSKKNGFDYTENGLSFNADGNVVNDIFNTKKGHSVYYSTTAISILRNLNIPCRLAAGFRSVKITNEIQILDSYYPYCWVECYFPNLGWVSFDPSPENEIEFSLDIPDVPKGANKNDKKTNTSKSKNFTFNILKIGKISFKVIPVLLVLAFVYLILRAFFAPMHYNYKIVIKRFKTTEKQCKFYLKDIRKQLSALSCKKHTGDTLRDEILRVCDTLDIQNRESLISILEMYEAICYAEKTPSQNEILQIYNAHLLLEKLLEKRLDPIKYILKRRILISFW